MKFILVLYFTFLVSCDSEVSNTNYVNYKIETKFQISVKSFPPLSFASINSQLLEIPKSFISSVLGAKIVTRNSTVSLEKGSFIAIFDSLNNLIELGKLPNQNEIIVKPVNQSSKPLSNYINMINSEADSIIVIRDLDLNETSLIFPSDSQIEVEFKDCNFTNTLFNFNFNELSQVTFTNCNFEKSYFINGSSEIRSRGLNRYSQAVFLSQTGTGFFVNLTSSSGIFIDCVAYGLENFVGGTSINLTFNRSIVSRVKNQVFTFSGTEAEKSSINIGASHFASNNIVLFLNDSHVMIDNTVFSNNNVEFNYIDNSFYIQRSIFHNVRKLIVQRDYLYSDSPADLTINKSNILIDENIVSKIIDVESFKVGHNIYLDSCYLNVDTTNFIQNSLLRHSKLTITNLQNTIIDIPEVRI